MQHFVARIRAAAQAVAAYFGRKGITYWSTAFVVFVISVIATHPADRFLRLNSIRYALFQELTEITHAFTPEFVKVVMIGDKDYYRPGLDNKNGVVNHSYLASLIRKLDPVPVAAIGLDVDMTLRGVAYSTVRPGDFTVLPPGEDKDDPYKEDKDLISAIEKAAVNHSIILGRRIIRAQDGRSAVISTDVYQVFGLCVAERDGVWENPGIPGNSQFALAPDVAQHISCGYLNPPNDENTVPLSVRVANQDDLVDSFALAVVRTHDKALAQNLSGRSALFLHYMSQDVVDKSNLVIPPGQLHDNSDALSDLQGHMVIIGGDYHKIKDSNDQNDMIDIHDAPQTIWSMLTGRSNKMPGALVLANHVEALLMQRTVGTIPGWMINALEILFGLGAAFLFAAYAQLWVKVALFFGLLTVLVFVQYIMLGLFGTYFDAVLPLLALALHSIGDRLIEARH
jgi:CHASE2 domain-containing sensor protein